MKKKFVHARDVFCPTIPATPKIVAGRGNYRVAMRPTVAVMAKADVNHLHLRGMKVVCTIPVVSEDSFREALELVKKMDPAAKVNFLTTLAHAGLFKDVAKGLDLTKYIRRLPASSSGIDVEVKPGPHGEPTIVIYWPSEPSSYTIKHVLKKENREEKKKNTPANDSKSVPVKFLKEPREDEFIITAMEAAAKDMLDEDHRCRLKYMEDGVYKFKMMNDVHLLVCLYYYIYVNRLHASGDFWEGQRKYFHQYCKDHLPESFDLCSDTYFSRCIANLQRACGGFEECIKSGGQMRREQYKGEFNLAFWYEIYRRASACFSRIIPPETGK